MIRSALNSLPTKPGMVLAIIVLVGTVSSYYYDQYQRCTYQASLREQLISNIGIKLNGTIALVDIVPFKWDRLKILKNIKPTGKLPDCSFGWDWSKGYRQSLIKGGELNMLKFTRKGVFPGYIDFRRDQINFSGTSGFYTQQSAEFTVTRQTQNSDGVLLKPVK